MRSYFYVPQKNNSSADVRPIRLTKQTNIKDIIMGNGTLPPRERTLAELLDAARGLADIEAAIAQLRGVAEMSEQDLSAFRRDDVVDAAAALASLECINQVLQATLQDLVEANAKLHGFGRLVLRDVGAAGAALFRVAPAASEAKN
ncbi:hypothetical protein AAFN86_28895 [Roseomonas sp. CAU 1739]|uniref:hypothetical protein n=1 Tax=Roseomonas sp. CAU 1739 TaxID=3140364 RepID=UPI00325BE556